MGTKYRVLAGLAVLAGLGALMSCGGYSSSTASNPGVTGTGSIYVATQGDQKLAVFSIDLSTSKITTNGTGLATGSVPAAAIMTPDRKAIFVANSGSGDLSRYTINADGTLAAVTPTQAVGGNLVSLAMDAAGKFLLVLSQGDPFALPPVPSKISVFSVGSGAALTPKTVTTVTVVTGNPPAPLASYDTLSVAITADAKFVYTANRADGSVTGYSMDASGNLTLVPRSPFAAGIGPAGLVATIDSATSPSSNPIFLYVANSGSNNISVFAVCDKVSLTCPTPDGTLTEITSSPVSAGTEPVGLVMVNPAVTTPPSGTFLYAVDKGSNQISQYSVATVTGALTTLGPVSTGLTPVSATARPDGLYLYVANSGGSSFSTFVITDPTKGNLTNSGAPTATATTPAAIVVK